MTVPEKTGIDGLREHGGASPVVAVDEYERPVALLVCERQWHTRPVLCADRADAVNEVALRAMASPQEVRFVPVACCDERGRLLGLVRVERLVEALARR